MIGGLKITNSLLMTWVVMILLTVFSLAATRKLTQIPGTLQTIAEGIIGGLYSIFKGVAGDHVDQFFPLLATIFLFVIVGNWIGLLPGVGSIGFRHEEESNQQVVSDQIEQGKKESEAHEEVLVQKKDEQGEGIEQQKETTAAASVEHPSEPKEEHGPKFTPLFRGPTADLNTTLALALIAVAAIQYFGFKNLGATYGSKFINFKSPIYFFIGILEMVSDLSKVLSFAFRLFGNVFAGEVLLTVIAFLMPLIAPLPFLGLEIFVGFVQALVFSMLTAVFLNMAVAHEEH